MVRNRIMCPCGHLLAYAVERLPAPVTGRPEVAPWGVAIYHRGGRNVRATFRTRALARYAIKQYIAQVAQMNIEDATSKEYHTRWWSDKR